jgi:hypothetical protein
MNYKLTLAVASAAALALAACSGGDGGTPSPDDGSATFAMTLDTDVDLTGHYVKIKGTRAAAADSAYKCSSGFEECFDISDGVPVFEIRGLCPTMNLSDDGTVDGEWLFHYEVGIGTCAGGGTALTSGDVGDYRNNFECFDWTTDVQRNIPNKSIDVSLAPGINNIEVVCLTRTSAVEWMFGVCAEESTDNDHGLGTFAYNCGCELSGSECVCSLDIPNDPDCPFLKANDCTVVCWGDKGANLVTLAINVAGKTGTLTAMGGLTDTTGPALNLDFVLEYNEHLDELKAILGDKEVTIASGNVGEMKKMNSVIVKADDAATAYNVTRIDGDTTGWTVTGTEQFLYHAIGLANGFSIRGTVTAGTTGTVTITVGQNLGGK